MIISGKKRFISLPLPRCLPDGRDPRSPFVNYRLCFQMRRYGERRSLSERLWLSPISFRNQSRAESFVLRNPRRREATFSLPETLR